jgi:hypothetical protein
MAKNSRYPGKRDFSIIKLSVLIVFYGFDAKDEYLASSLWENPY